ncbi:MAG: amidase [Bowdeniella nasicola]|nr:amidase [Bowdeniella nasicola]
MMSRQNTASDLHRLSAAELARAYRAGHTDPVEVTRHLLKRMQTHGEPVGAFAHVTADRALADAEAARVALAAGDRRPLLGVPCPIKDLTRVAGEPWEAGSVLLRGNRANVTDGVAQRLAEAGTVLLGKTSTPEFGMPAYTEPAIGRPARTPWDLDRTAGGSSGGAAAALAAGLAPLAHGNDGGGSIRIPAACCGVVGLKPSRGRVSPGPYGEAGAGLAVEGVLTRTVMDAALALDAISGNRAGDTFTLPALRAADALARLEREDALERRGGAPVRIGLLMEPLNVESTEVHPEARRAAEDAAAHLEAAGCEVRDVSRAMSAEEWMSFMPLWAVGAAAIPVPPEAEGHLMPLTRYLRELGRAASAVELNAAIQGVQRLTRQITAHWADVDLICSPTLSGPAAYPDELQLADPAADFEAQKHFTPWSSVWNITGHPAISVPTHRAEVRGRDGVSRLLPFGVHIGATRLGDEVAVLAAARVLERAAPWPRLAPDVA